jgi:hypothetical protein
MRQKMIVGAVALALACPTGIAVAGSIPTVKPDTLLAIDSNRATVVEGIVNTWGATPEDAGVGISRAELRVMLQKLRADQLLAASVAGSASGLRDVLTAALSVSKQMNTKALATRTRT